MSNQNEMPMAPRPELLDEGIREVTMLLWNAGFWTFSACQGGDGHCALGEQVGAFIRLYAKPGSTVDQTRADVVKYLLDAGYRGFESSSIYHHASNQPASVVSNGLVQITFGYRLPVRPFG